MFKSEGTSHWEGLIPALTTCIAVLALARQFLPQEWVRLVRRVSHRLTDYFNPFVVFVIPEFSSDSSAVETSYDKAKQYLSARGTDTAHRLVVSRARNTATPTFTLVRIICTGIFASLGKRAEVVTAEESAPAIEQIPTALSLYADILGA